VRGAFLFGCLLVARLVAACGASAAGDDGAFRFGPAGPSDGALPLVIVHGMQFRWTVEYPTGAEASELVVPLGRAIRLEVRSSDVEHRFEVEGSRLRIDAPPGGATVRRLEGLAPATLRTRCSVNCGPMPETFSIPVRVVPADEFDRFVTGLDQPPTDRSMAVYGRDVYVESGCQACHSVGIGDALTDLPGSTRELDDGSSLLLDEATFAPYVRESITAPRARVERGWSSPMPAYAGLRAVQLDALVAYLACQTQDCASRTECAGVCAAR
jgi:cytochrome c oxidase subunit 2